MKIDNKIKIAIPLVFILAILLGLLQHGKLLGSHNQTFNNSPSLADKSLEDFYEQAKNLAPASQTATTSVSFLAVGDINLSRNVASEIEKQKNTNYPFLQMADILKSTDFNFANLESPMSNNAKNDVIGGHSLVFAAPGEDVNALITNNFKILNLANNHAMDQGLNGLLFTKKYLNTVDIKTDGTGENLDEAWQPAVVAATGSFGMQICFVGASYASINDGGKTRNDYVARMEDLDKLKTAITTAKAECDFTVATMHGGIEYTRTPNNLQTTFAHAAIDDGADIVIGAHPHWVQTIEKYNGKYIFYSLGNFIFDQAWSQDTSEGLTLKITISKNTLTNTQTPNAAKLDDLQGSRIPAALDSIELIPVIITNSQPRPATADETKKILQKIGETNTVIK